MGVLLFSCDHATIDPESSINNATQNELKINIYDDGLLFYEGTIRPEGSRYYCTCQPININADSMIFKSANGDSIIYHHPQINNSNFEETKLRSPFVEGNWGEISKNVFQYTILSEDFQ